MRRARGDRRALRSVVEDRHLDGGAQVGVLAGPLRSSLLGRRATDLHIADTDVRISTQVLDPHLVSAALHW